MTSTPEPSTAALAARLGVPETDLSGLATCGSAGLATVERLVEASFTREDRAVESGLEKTLQVIPRPLRRRARAMLFPGSAE